MKFLYVNKQTTNVQNSGILIHGGLGYLPLVTKMTAGKNF